MLLVYITKFEALLVRTCFGEQPAPSMADLERRGNTNSLLLTTGAKLGYHTENKWYIYGYAEDGCDVTQIVQRLDLNASDKPVIENIVKVERDDVGPNDADRNDVNLANERILDKIEQILNRNIRNTGVSKPVSITAIYDTLEEYDI